MPPEYLDPNQVKDTIVAGQQAWEAVEKFVHTAAWVGPWVIAVSAHLAPWFSALQKIPGFNLIAGNYGKATNKE